MAYGIYANSACECCGVMLLSTWRNGPLAVLAAALKSLGPFVDNFRTPRWLTESMREVLANGVGYCCLQHVGMNPRDVHFEIKRSRKMMLSFVKSVLVALGALRS